MNRSCILQVLPYVMLMMATFGQADEQTPQSAQEVRPLLIGAKIPDSLLQTREGKTLNLVSRLGGEPAVIVFYRGGW